MESELLIIGNGLSIALFKHLNLNIHPSHPFSFQIILEHNNKPIFDELGRLKKLKDSASNKEDFEIIDDFVTNFSEDNEHKWLHCELRHFLSLAYSYAYFQTKSKWKNNWKWLKWIYQHKNEIGGIVSFNYDLSIELALNKLAIDFFRLGSSEEVKGIPIFKPHGSCDFDINKRAILMPVDSRLKCLTLLNDGGNVEIVPEKELLIPRIEADIVLPFEHSNQTLLSWVQTGFEKIKQITKSVKVCTIIGISYHQSDRKEIDLIIDNLSTNVKINLINLHPNVDLKKKLLEKTKYVKEYTPLDFLKENKC